jgi:hypothetical protein
MYSLQTSVQIGQASFEIRNKGDFRMVLDCFEALNDPELSESERLYSALIIFYEDFEDIIDVIKHEDILFELSTAMMKFFNCGEEAQSNTDGYKLIDWKKDSNLICSAVNNVAKQEVRALEYLHWWTFVGYYTAIGDCPLTTIICIRSKIAHGEKLDKPEKKFRDENPEFFNIDMRSSDQQWAEDYVKQLWGGEQ